MTAGEKQHCHNYNYEYEEAPFLDAKDEDEETLLSVVHHRSTTRCSRFWQRPILIHLLLILAYTSIFIFTISHVTHATSTSFINSPRQRTVFSSFLISPFVGNRSTTTDSAWHTLLSPINQRVSLQELQSNEITSISITNFEDEGVNEAEIERDEFLAWPAALHQLHCVKRLREWIYRDQYHPNLNAREVARWTLHVDHCIDLLRQSIMCNPDPALVGFHWDERSEKPAINDEGAVHQCVNWGAFVNGLRTRSVSSDEMKGLKRPGT